MKKKGKLILLLLIVAALAAGGTFYAKDRKAKAEKAAAEALQNLLHAEEARLKEETGLDLSAELLPEKDENGCPRAILKLNGKEVGRLALEKTGGSAAQPAEYKVKEAVSTVYLNVIMGRECVLTDGSRQYSYDSGNPYPVCKLVEQMCILSSQFDPAYTTRNVVISGLYDISQLSGTIRGKEVKFLPLEEENTYFATLEMTPMDKESAREAAAAMVSEVSGGKAENLRVSDPVFLMHCCAIVDGEYTAEGQTKQFSLMLCLDDEGRWYRCGITPELSFPEASVPRTEQRPYLDPDKKIGGKMPYHIAVNRTQNCATVYTLDEQGEYTVPVRAMVCSTGREGHETPLGEFSIGSFKPKWCYMEDGSYGQFVSKFRSDGYLFHTICYHKKDPATMMVNEYNMLGGYASLGCVRLQTFDAVWVYYNCQPGTTVTIYEDENPGPLGKPTTFIEEITPEMDNGWDPTDPRPENPWRYINL